MNIADTGQVTRVRPNSRGFAVQEAQLRCQTGRRKDLSDDVQSDQPLCCARRRPSAPVLWGTGKVVKKRMSAYAPTFFWA